MYLFVEASLCVGCHMPGFGRRAGSEASVGWVYWIYWAITLDILGHHLSKDELELW